MNIAHPLGLLALGALPLVWWLHRHVVQARLREVSCLALWADRELVRHEGAQRQRVPDRLVLLLELLAALALAALLAGVDFEAAAAPRATVGFVIDGSASMAGGEGDGRPLQQVRALLAQLKQQHRELQVSMVVAGELPELLGERVMRADQADALLASYQPHASACNLAPALELIDALGVDAQSTWLFSDDPALEHPRLVRVGRASDNSAIVDSGWEPGESPYVVVRRWSRGGTRAQVKLQVEVDGTRSESLLTLPPDGAQPFALPVGQHAARVDVTLPDDALALDNHVTLLRPFERRVRVRAAGVSEALARALEQAVRAIPTLQAVRSGDAELTVSENPSNAPRGHALVFLSSGTGKDEQAALALQPEPDPFASLLDGFDGRDLIWLAFARTPPSDARVLLRSGERALIWQREQSVFVNAELEHGNLLAHAAFPILLANLADELDRGLGGPPRSMFRQGEHLRFDPPRGSKGELLVRTPSGRNLRFEHGHPIELGVLDEAGVYQLEDGSNNATIEDRPLLFAVSLASEAESALSSRRMPDARRPALAPSARAPALARSQLRVPLLLLLLLSCGLAFVLLEPRGARGLRGERA